ncbi:MAG TPA: hypothetical protein VF896_04290 [Anaerolineales bacterium]
MNDDTRRLIYGTIIAFLLFIVFWLSIVYISACGFTLTCIQAAPLVERTPIPTLIPVKQAQQPAATAVEFNQQCKVAATDLIGAWISAGHPEKEPFPFTDLNGQSCEGTFADIQPLFVENSVWFPGSLGCTSCHNADLTDRSKGLDLSSYQAISLGTRRVAGSSSPGTDIFGGGDLQKSLLYQVLTKQGLTVLTKNGQATQGHSPDAPPNQAIIYAGQLVAEGNVTATPTP